MRRFGCSQRNALCVVRMSASTYLYKSLRRDETALTMRIKDLTSTRVHYAYRQVHVMLRRELLHVEPTAVAEVRLDVVSADSARPSFVCAHCGAQMIILQTFVRGQSIRAPPPRRGDP